MTEVFPLFPTPVMRAARVLDPPLVDGLVAHFSSRAFTPNNASDQLSHTTMLKPSDSPLLVEVARRLSPPVAEFGAHLFGEPLGWSLKELWVNVLEEGGRQAMHNHANSFVSGVVYLTPTHPESRTVFMRGPGGQEFAFRNDHDGVATTPFNAEKWVGPQPEPGDAILFPSYLLHAVPPNRGARRVTLAFNAIPASLDSWGYRISFAG